MRVYYGMYILKKTKSYHKKDNCLWFWLSVWNRDYRTTEYGMPKRVINIIKSLMIMFIIILHCHFNIYRVLSIVINNGPSSSQKSIHWHHQHQTDAPNCNIFVFDQCFICTRSHWNRRMCKKESQVIVVGASFYVLNGRGKHNCRLCLCKVVVNTQCVKNIFDVKWVIVK